MLFVKLFVVKIVVKLEEGRGGKGVKFRWLAEYLKKKIKKQT